MDALEFEELKEGDTLICIKDILYEFLPADYRLKSGDIVTIVKMEKMFRGKLCSLRLLGTQSDIYFGRKNILELFDVLNTNIKKEQETIPYFNMVL